MKATADTPVTAEQITEMVRASRVDLDWSAFDAAEREKQAIRKRMERNVARIERGTLRGRLLTIFTR